MARRPRHRPARARGIRGRSGVGARRARARDDSFAARTAAAGAPGERGPHVRHHARRDADAGWRPTAAETETEMKRAWLLAVALILGATFPRAAAPTITIDASTPAGKVSPLLYGLMTEEINHSYDGGLYAELIRNRAFVDDAASPAHWSPVQADGTAATIALDKGQPLNAVIGTSLRLDVTQASAGHAAG